MKLKALLLIFTFPIFCKVDLKKDFEAIEFVEFNKSINIDLPAKLDKVTKEKLEIYRKLYLKNHPTKIGYSKDARIPKIIHQIWIGGAFPDRFKGISNKWKQMHPDWQYILWNDNNIRQLFPLYNQKYFDESKNPGEKTDILRYEILLRYGGLYVDVDFECIKRFDILNHCYDFYAGIEPIDASPLFIGNAFIAACPNSPILKNCIHTIKNFRKEKNIPLRTGPAHLTRAFFNLIDVCDHYVMAFPTTYLYPLGFKQKHLANSRNLYLKKETFGVHYWTGSWNKK